jgi:hypothetical protein
MPTFEKTSGGQVLLRGIDRRVSVGDRVDATGGYAEYLRGRGDFQEVDVQDAEFREVDDSGTATPDIDASEGDTLPFNPEEHTNDEVAERVADIDDVETLIALRNLEEEQQDRAGATDAIEDRIDDLETDADTEG